MRARSKTPRGIQFSGHIYFFCLMFISSARLFFGLLCATFFFIYICVKVKIMLLGEMLLLIRAVFFFFFLFIYCVIYFSFILYMKWKFQRVFPRVIISTLSYLFSCCLPYLCLMCNDLFLVIFLLFFPDMFYN